MHKKLAFTACSDGKGAKVLFRLFPKQLNKGFQYKGVIRQ
jgi:hypothetical protein